MSQEYYLYGSGRHPAEDWPALHESAEGWTAAWADVEGFHFTVLPERMPVTTHLWAWKPDRWLRVRIDGQHWWASLLVHGTDHPRPDWAGYSETVEVTSMPMLHWPTADRRVQQFRQAPNSQNVLEMTELFQLTPLRQSASGMFIGAGPMSPESASPTLRGNGSS
ncbi:hypothetical protein [Haloechinothrix sp. LS1_15]|uniref:hypothetical protein n=1 Tax=Haloechinothrix sp. LS1_15 TaxID=2652248 RepID=UPI002948A828|nr:hypothetical protein [Haloechinothrix sp. LS1_15]MDV6011654.1 hypothetical protein [Haloechinothrix sp. LS1_15]